MAPRKETQERTARLVIESWMGGFLAAHGIDSYSTFAEQQGAAATIPDYEKARTLLRDYCDFNPQTNILPVQDLRSLIVQEVEFYNSADGGSYSNSQAQEDRES